MGSWLRFMDHQETHFLFDLWAGMWVLSNAVGSRTTVGGPAGNVPLNLYVLFVADSGLARKSTAVNTACSLLQRTKLNAHWVTRGVSPDRLFREATSSHLIFTASELVTLLGKSSTAYQLPGLLTDLYDGQDGGRQPPPDQGPALRARYTTFLGAAAPSWLVGSINQDVLLGGFSSRLVVVAVGRGKGLRPWPTDLVDDTEALKELEHVAQRLDHPVAVRPDLPVGRDGDQVEQARGPCLRLDRSAVELYQQLYIQHSRTDHQGSFLPSFYSRWSTHVLKCAGLLAINRGGEEVTGEDLSTADTLIRTAGEHGDRVFNRGRDQQLKSIDAVKRVLVRQGMNLSSLTELSRKVGTTNLRPILDTLQDLDMIQAVEVKGVRGRPTLLYRATTRMLEVSSEQVNRMMNR
jgi:hypothetical protein